MEREITVLVTTSLEELEKELIKQRFEETFAFEMIDEYMIKKEVDIAKTPNLEVLSNCVLIRNVVDEEMKLVYKNKKYDSLGNILEESKVSCPITDIAKAIKFMEAIGYTKLLTVKNKTKEYSDGNIKIAVQHINDEFITIEIEAENNETIEDLISKLNKYDLSISKESYFVKKAEILLKKLK